jgi:hypothetical protein
MRGRNTMHKRSLLLGAATLTIVLTFGIGSSAAAAGGHGALVTHHLPFCNFEPGDVPGVNVFFPADCLSVVTPSGQATIFARGQLPSGYSLVSAFEGSLPCSFFGQTVLGHVAATPSGVVRATCHFAHVGP